MNDKEREIFYKLLLDLFVEKPAQHQKSQPQEGQNHEKVSTRTRTKRARN